MVNTEKPLAKQEQKKQAAAPKPKTEKQAVAKAPVKKEEKKVEDKKTEKPKEVKKEPVKKKKDFAIVKGNNLHMSPKVARDICKFIKYKKISDAIKDLEEVIAMRKAVPMKGEIPHRKGKMMSGRYPVKACKGFIVLLKSLSGNANVNEIENPLIVEAIANIGERPYGRFGSIRRKRAHVQIKAKQKKERKAPSKTVDGTKEKK